MLKNVRQKSLDMGRRLGKHMGGWARFFFSGPHDPVILQHIYPLQDKHTPLKALIVLIRFW